MAYAVRNMTKLVLGMVGGENLQSSPRVDRLTNQVYLKKNEMTVASHELAQEETTDLATQLFESLLASRPKEEAGSCAWIEKAHEIVSELPEYQAMRRVATGSGSVAWLGTLDAVDAVKDAVDDIFKAAEEEQKRKQEQQDQESQGEENQDGANGPSGGNRPSEVEENAMMMAKAKMRRAIKDSAEKMQGLKDAIGLLPGHGGGELSEDALSSEAEMLAEYVSNESLRRALKYLGRLRRMAMKQKLEQDPDARTEIMGVEAGNDISRLTPMSMALLFGGEAAQMKFCQDYMERSLQQFKLKGKSRKGRGNLTILVDASGSMDGMSENGLISNFQLATAIALAISMLVVEDGRQARICLFNYSICHTAEFKEAISFPEMRSFLGRRPGGGTSLGSAMKQLLDGNVGDFMVCDDEDLVVITDGHVEALSEETVEVMKCMREAHGARVFSMTLNQGALHPSVESISDVYVDIDTSSDQRIAEMVAQCLSEK